LSQRFNSLASQAANSEECFEFLDNALHAIEKLMEEKWKWFSVNTSRSVQSTSQMPESLAVATRETRHDLPVGVKLQMIQLLIN
jgi:hypothetical protein